MNRHNRITLESEIVYCACMNPDLKVQTTELCHFEFAFEIVTNYQNE
jgi:hypothetical protein